MSLSTVDNTMTPESQDFEEDELLAALNTDQEYDFEHELGTQIPVDMGEIEEFESTASSTDSANHNVQDESMMEHSAEKTSAETVPATRDDEDIVDVEDCSPITTDVGTLNKK